MITQDLALREPENLQNFFFIAKDMKYSFYDDQECTDYGFDGKNIQKIKTTKHSGFTANKSCYCAEKNLILTFSSNNLETNKVLCTSSYYNTDLLPTEY